MARILNIISQIIHLSKKAKKQVEKGKYSSAKRIFKIILNIEEKELIFIKEESGSEDFYKECLSIVQSTKEAFQDLSKFQVRETVRLLDKIIALENYELKNIIKAKKGLEEDILNTVDPYIQELVNEINKLSFVKTTHFSCSGHFPNDFTGPYLVIEYDWESKTQHNIKAFHSEMINIVDKSGIVNPTGILIRLYHNLMGLRKVNYYLGFPVELPTKRSQKEFKHQIVKQWNLISNLVKKYQDNDSLEYKKQRRRIKKNHELLGTPENKKLISQGIIVKCLKCNSFMITMEPKPICKKCGYKIGDIIY
ncbi:MAG: hypothetical protein AABW48_00010 [Nanoarchaeota archaeon]